ncbi:MAG: sulfite exporter TauE/SafE family protein, partial [Planctomyces sp.]
MSILFGIITGISLGLTGGGGAVFAVPMLVYGLGIPTRQAVL